MPRLASKKPTVSLDRLKELLAYDPKTGVFTWKITRGGYASAGTLAGGIHPWGYRRIKINKRVYPASWLAWYYMTGDWPGDLDGLPDIDHWDLNKANDSWENLRLATHGKNVTNSHVRRHSKTGLKGVHAVNTGGYIARITPDKKRIYLGYFDCPAAAHFAYAIAADKAFGEFARAS